MKTQVLAAIIGTVTAITSATAHADNYIYKPNSITTRTYPVEERGRVVCTLTQLNPAGGAPISKTTLESPGSFREATIEFKGKDSQTIGSVDLRDGRDSISIVMKVGGVEEFGGWRYIGESTSLRQPVDNKMIDCTVRAPFFPPSVQDQLMGIRQRPDHGYGWHGGASGGQQWTIGQTTFAGQTVVEARFDINSKVFADDKVINFTSNGFIIGYQVNSGWGKDSTTNGSWKEGDYINTIWGIGTDSILLRFSNQPWHKMNYSVSVFYLQYPLR